MLLDFYPLAITGPFTVIQDSLLTRLLCGASRPISFFVGGGPVPPFGWVIGHVVEWLGLWVGGTHPPTGG